MPKGATQTEVREYQTKAGVSPFGEWFDSLEAKAASKVASATRMMELGSFGDCKPVGAGVSERRIDYGPGYRVYFAKDGDRLVLLLGGSTKRRQDKHIADAQERWKEYKARKRAGKD